MLARPPLLYLPLALVCVGNGADAVTFPDDAGVLDVRDFGAIGDGVADDTAAIQRALDFDDSGNRIVFVPDGTYLISDRLDWPEASQRGLGEKRTILQGQSRDGAVIRLVDDAAGYQDPSNRRAMVFTGRKPAQRFRNAIRELTFDSGNGNEGAVGLQFIANNQGGIRDVTIRSGDGSGVIGLDMAYTDEHGPLLVSGLEVEGFDRGIETRFQTASVTFENITLRNQNELGWRNEGQTVFARGLNFEGSVTGFRNIKDAPSQALLLDVTANGTAGASNTSAVINNRAMVVDGIQSTGFSRALLNDDKGRGNPSPPGDTVGFYLSHADPVKLFPAPDTRLNLPVRETPRLAFDTPEDWANAADFLGTSGGDFGRALQAAIDSGARTVYVPNSSNRPNEAWTLNREVLVRGNVERILGTEARITGSGGFRVTEGASDTVVIERIETDTTVRQDSDRTLVLSSILGVRYDNTASGTGDLFIEDVAFGDAVTFRNQDVWARQFNQETDTQATGDRAKIVNDGGNLWILGLKTEQAGTILHTENGGRSELLGGYIFANGQQKQTPMFTVEDADFGAAGVFQFTFNDAGYDTWARETRDGETRSLNGNFGTSGVFHGFGTSVPEPVVGIPLLGVALLRRRRRIRW